jgi:hypothetical protein
MLPVLNKDDGRYRWMLNGPGYKPQEPISKIGKNIIGKNIDRLRLECGWSKNELAIRMNLDREQVRGHLTGKVKPRERALKIYSDMFTSALERKVTVAELLSSS